MRKPPSLYFVEITDTFGGEANYSWVTRHIIRAQSARGAMTAISRRSGLHWRYDGFRYNSASGATCAFVEAFDPEAHANYRFNDDDRKVQA